MMQTLNRLAFLRPPYTEILGKTFWRIIQAGSNGGCQFLQIYFLSGILPPPALAAFIVFFSFIYFLVIFTDWGVSVAVAKLTAENTRGDRRGDRLAILSLAVLLTLALALFMALGVHVAADPLARFFRNDLLSALFPLALFLLPLMTLTRVLEGILRGHQQFRFLAVVVFAGLFLQLGLVVRLAGTGAPLDTLIRVIVLINALMAAAMLFRIFRLTPPRPVRTAPFGDWLRPLVRFSIPLGVGAASYYLYTQVDMLILAHYRPAGEVAWLEIAYKIYYLPFALISAFTFVFLPFVSRALQERGWSYIHPIYRKCQAASFLFLIVPALVLLFFSDRIVLHLFPAYPPAARVLRIFAPLMIFSAYTAILGTFLVANGRPGAYAVFLGIGAFLNLFLDLVFIPRYGAMGAAATTLGLHSIMAAAFSIAGTGIFRQLSQNARVPEIGTEPVG